MNEEMKQLKTKIDDLKYHRLATWQAFEKVHKEHIQLRLRKLELLTTFKQHVQQLKVLRKEFNDLRKKQREENVSKTTKPTE